MGAEHGDDRVRLDERRPRLLFERRVELERHLADRRAEVVDEDGARVGHGGGDDDDVEEERRLGPDAEVERRPDERRVETRDDVADLAHDRVVLVAQARRLAGRVEHAVGAPQREVDVDLDDPVQDHLDDARRRAARGRHEAAERRDGQAQGPEQGLGAVRRTVAEEGDERRQLRALAVDDEQRRHDQHREERARRLLELFVVVVRRELPVEGRDERRAHGDENDALDAEQRARRHARAHHRRDVHAARAAVEQVHAQRPAHARRPPGLARMDRGEARGDAAEGRAEEPHAQRVVEHAAGETRDQARVEGRPDALVRRVAPGVVAAPRVPADAHAAIRERVEEADGGRGEDERRARPAVEKDGAHEARAGRERVEGREAGGALRGDDGDAPAQIHEHEEGHDGFRSERRVLDEEADA